MNAPQRPPAARLRPARRAASASSSIVREILKVTMRPEVISLAGGLPAPESFPVDALRAAFDAELRDDGQARQALQYSTTEGYPPLREWIAAQESARGVPTAPDEVLIVAGSQQALDLLGKAFVEPEAPLLVESPTYLGALQAFNLFDPTYRALPTDDAGLQPQAIDAALARDARALYVMPNFQNPSGRTLSPARRVELAQAARRHDLWLIEDDPYGELWFRQAPPPSLRSVAPERTIRVCSFSKVLAPGLRLGFVIAPRECIELLVRLKQATDLHTATLTQRAAHRVLATGLLEAHLPQVRARYARQCEAMLAALDRSMPAGVRWTRPEGGMFVWLTLPAGVDAMALLPRAIERNVAFVPGEPFFAAAPMRNTLRLSFVTVPPPRIEAAVATLGELIASAMASNEETR
ncbi:MAG: PLP-dependent aminotransferase family protein [Burkholderiaceae bacterium]|nr:PLP-dependent aminotransferase family protein [Burkholderiaceae bacterium]